MHGGLGAPEEDPASLISVADRITVTVTEFSNTSSITVRWRNKENRALGSSDRGELTILIRFGVGISSRSGDIVLSNEFMSRDWRVQLRHIPRSGNPVANKLARMSRGEPIGETLFDRPPLEVILLLEKDLINNVP
ncbi:hypothetical protein GQ457_04G007790 [Hibiscus cannabinus]